MAEPLKKGARSRKPAKAAVPDSLLKKIGLIREGVTKDRVLDIKEDIEIDYDQLSRILAVSRATITAKKKDGKFKPDASERILHLNDVIRLGHQVFGERPAFNLWLKSPSKALGNVSPLSVMDTIYGIEEVKKEILRIAHGVF
jgi:putative toxin-antitoxin system antitoxin component (TIGR02293 family)